MRARETFRTEFKDVYVVYDINCHYTIENLHGIEQSWNCGYCFPSSDKIRSYRETMYAENSKYLAKRA